jgi:CBS domain-containing protein
MKIYGDIVYCQQKDKVQTAAKKIASCGVRHAYVVDGRRLVGVLAGADILRLVASGKYSPALEVKDAMNPVHSVKPDTGVEYAYAIMRNFNTLICPVVSENGDLIGYCKFHEVCEEMNRKV